MANEDTVGFEDADCCEWMDAGAGGGGGGGGKGDRKRRFSEEQIRSLESMFSTQTKLEPRQKLQLAKELGLQPRQVAIWFQNKRARWKSKQLEKEYTALREDYDALLCSYESLKKEKQVLLKQLEKLAELPQEPRGARSKHGNAGTGHIADGNGDMRSNVSLKEEFDTGAAFYSSEGDNKFMEFGDEEANLFRPPQPPHTAFSSAAAEHQFHFHSGWPSSDQTCSNLQWWEFESLSE